MNDADKIFLEYVVKALVDNPNDVKIDRTVDEMGVLISLTVNPAMRQSKENWKRSSNAHLTWGITSCVPSRLTAMNRNKNYIWQ